MIDYRTTSQLGTWSTKDIFWRSGWSLQASVCWEEDWVIEWDPSLLWILKCAKADHKLPVSLWDDIQAGVCSLGLDANSAVPLLPVFFSAFAMGIPRVPILYLWQQVLHKHSTSSWFWGPHIALQMPSNLTLKSCLGRMVKRTIYYPKPHLLDNLSIPL
jgi:hypothetical protein